MSDSKRIVKKPRLDAPKLIYYYVALDRSDTNLVPLKLLRQRKIPHRKHHFKSSRVQDHARQRLSEIFTPKVVNELYLLRTRPSDTIEQVLWEAFVELMTIEHMTLSLLWHFFDLYKKGNKNAISVLLNKTEEDVENYYKTFYSSIDAFEERMKLAVTQFRKIITYCADSLERAMNHLVSIIGALDNVYDIDNRSRSMPNMGYAIVLLDQDYKYKGHVFANQPVGGECGMIGIRASLESIFSRLCQVERGQFVRPMLDAVGQWCRLHGGDSISPHEPLEVMAMILEKMGFSEIDDSYKHSLYNANTGQVFSFSDSVLPLRLGTKLPSTEDFELLRKFTNLLMMVKKRPSSKPYLPFIIQDLERILKG